MDTDKCGNGTYVNSRFDNTQLTIIGFVCVVLVTLTSCYDSSTDAPPPPVETQSSAQDLQVSEGQSLYAANCAGCHGPDGSTINGNSPDAINSAITNIGTMSGISLTATEIQAISDFLTGNTTDTGSGSDADGSTSDGQALYAANCAGCHGADGSTLSGRTGAQIAAAIVNVSTMSGVSLSGTEIQAIADFLGGGTVGDSSGGAPASHTNSEDGIMHAPGNTLPFSSGCTVCHGASLQGGVGPSCFTCHGQRWNEGPSSAGSGTASTGSSDGQALYTTYCSACHGITGFSLTGSTTDQISTAISNVTVMNGIALSLAETQAIADYLSDTTSGSTGGATSGGDTGGGSGTLDGQTLFADNCGLCHGSGSGINDPSVSGITAAITNIGSMTGIALTSAEIQAISDHLTGSTGGASGGNTGGGSGTLDGQTLFADNCGLCHGSGSGINDPSVSGITAAITNIGSMTGIALSSAEIQAISDHLTGSTGGTSGGDTGGSTGSLPTTHTNSEEGVLHAEGNITPYSSGCTSCHGSTLQGAIGPSCFACHGVEWNETAPSGSTSGGGSGTIDGQALYTASCSGCHGSGSGINDPSVSGITAAITNIGSMTGIALSSAEIQAISDHLSGSAGGSTGGGDTGSGDSSGPPASHTNSEDGILHAPGNNYPYTNGCTACHGASLQGGIGPSCYACHGQEWNESAPSGGSTGSTGSGGSSTTDGQALYTSNCSACHGASGSSINGRTASAITTAIANIGSMNGISLASAEIQAIADYLAGSTGGGTTGGSTGGLPTSHTNSEEGVLHAPGNDYPYTNGCTSCHGSTLQGEIAPSCYSCHGQEWREGGSTSSSDGDSH